VVLKNLPELNLFHLPFLFKTKINSSLTSLSHTDDGCWLLQFVNAKNELSERQKISCCQILLAKNLGQERKNGREGN
jgi:hypothetical protein